MMQNVFGEGRRKIERMCVFRRNEFICTYVSLVREAQISRVSLGKYFIVFCCTVRIKYKFLPNIYSIFEKLFDDVDLWLLELKIKSISFVWECVRRA